MQGTQTVKNTLTLNGTDFLGLHLPKYFMRHFDTFLRNSLINLPVYFAVSICMLAWLPASISVHT